VGNGYLDAATKEMLMQSITELKYLLECKKLLASNNYPGLLVMLRNIKQQTSEVILFGKHSGTVPSSYFCLFGCRSVD
jgi:hypothetical protein